MLSLIDWLQSLIVKVLIKLISLYVIRDILEVNQVKNPLPLGMGVSELYHLWLSDGKNLLKEL